MNNSQRRRVWLVVIGMSFFAAIIISRLVSFQVISSEQLAEYGARDVLVVDRPERGIVYDRNGAVLAANEEDYQIGVSPSAVEEPAELATALAPVLQRQRYQLLAAVQSNRPYVLLASRASEELADTVRELPYSGVQVEPMPRRFYPQNELMCHTLGFANFDGEGQSGLEAYYDRELAGEAGSNRIIASPLDVPAYAGTEAREGADLILTIDRTVQHTVERHLREAVEAYEATGGSIIVMDPRTGAILAMASLPCYDPNVFYESDVSVLQNPIVGQQFEPGSVMKLMTMAAALDSGIVNSQSTYVDTGELYVGGHLTLNATRQAYGTVDMTTLLGQSLNVGAATLAVWMGSDTFYDYMQRFGFGRPTGVDLAPEVGGLMPLPGDELWTESFLATNSYGQSIAVTPLQMATAISALANDGLMMQPYIVAEIDYGNGRVEKTEPKVLSQPIRPETAQQLTAMAVNALNSAIPQAQVWGYTVAGKTGTAQIPENGVYHPTDVIGTFAGWLPADDPEVVIYVKLDRPSVPWGSQTAAPTFSRLAYELVVLLGIPPDEIRLQGDVLAARSP